MCDPTPDAEALTEIVPVRMTKAERALWEGAADKTDQKLSAWIRDCVSKAATKAQKKR